MLVWFIGFVLVALTLLSGILGSGRHLLFDYVSLFPQWWYLIPVSVLLISLFFVFRSMRVKIFALIFCALLMAGVGYQMDVVWQNDNLVIKEPTYRVLSWNTAIWETHENDGIFEIMQKHLVDFYIFQEAEYKKNKEMYAEFVYRFPEMFAGHYGEFFTVSKYPMECETPDRSGSFLTCTTYTPTGPLTLINVHLKRPFHVSNFRTYEDYEIRKAQFAALQKVLARTTTPVIVAGDFNSPKNYEFVRVLREGFAMNNPAGRLVIPHTFSSRWPYIRIDYQFTRGDYDFCDYKHISYPEISDHIGIIGGLCLRE